MSDDPGVGLRIVVISTVQPLLEPLVPILRELGHEPVAILSARRRPDAPSPGVMPALTDETAPKGLDLLFVKDSQAIEPLVRAYEPDVALCWGFPWKIPLPALQVPRYGSANCHPAKLPRHRGPIPFAWALREGDPELGVTWHRMDAELDTGAILAQTTVPIEDSDTTILDIGPRVAAASFGLLPLVLEKLAAGDPGEPQDDSLATWAGHFEADYAEVDWSRPARSVHNQVRAWHLTFGLSEIVAPVADVDGERLRLVRTSLTDPGDPAARRVECGDGPIWIVESERLDAS